MNARTTPSTSTTSSTGRFARRGRRLPAVWLTAGLASSLATGIAIATPAGRAAAATTIHVSNTADDGSATSLRAAIDTANAAGGDWSIRLKGGQTYVLNRQCQHGDLDDNHGGDLDLLSNGNYRIDTGSMLVATIEVTCAGERVLDHHGTGSLRLDQIRLTGGNTPNGPSGDQAGDRDGGSAPNGGAIRSSGLVDLSRTTIDGNRTGNGGNGAPPLFAGTGGNGGNGGLGSAIYANAVELRDVVVTGNTTGNGGTGGNALGVGNAGGNGGHAGSGTIAAASVVITESLISGNVAGNGGKGGAGLGAGAPGGDGGDGGHGGGSISTTLEVQATTFEGNTTGAGGAGGSGNGATGGDGGDGGRGGAAIAAVMDVHSSTIHGNTAAPGGAGGSGTSIGIAGLTGYGGALASTAANGTHIGFSTITSNQAIAAANLSVPVSAVLTGTIVADPLGGGANCSGFVVSGGGNAMDNASCGIGPDDELVSPMPLSPIGDHGGNARTRMPVAGSTLDGMIPQPACAAMLGDVMSDQRGEPRPVDGCEPGATELGRVDLTSYVPLGPARVFDTREPGPYSGYVGAEETLTVTFAGSAGIPASGVTAVAFNLTLDQTAGPEYVTVSPTGAPRPFTSSINAAVAGQTVPNLVIVPLGTNGQVDFFVQRGAHLVADVVGYFTPARSGAAAGRILPVDPVRAFDTREGFGGFVPAGGSRDFQVTGIGDVPATGVAAVVINLTGTQAGNAGYVTMWPKSAPQPFTGSLNLARPGHTAGNMTIVPVGADGSISVYSQSGAHLIGDVTGWVTDGDADHSTHGLFVPITPARWFDTREPAPAPGSIGAGETRSIAIPSWPQVPELATAILFNLTATDPAEPGFITGWAHGAPMPTTSSLNLDDGVLRGNAALLKIGDDAMVSFYANQGAHLVADAYGFLTPHSGAGVGAVMEA